MLLDFIAVKYKTSISKINYLNYTCIHHNGINTLLLLYIHPSDKVTATTIFLQHYLLYIILKIRFKLILLRDIYIKEVKWASQLKHIKFY